ncbi:MAG: TIGR02266 family protein [Deltaproteobacteria bacterium]|nr:TIGR02266 family protein [Deltaproteobacteria bacterium]
MAHVDRAPRKAVNLLIRLNYPSEAAFAVQYATNLSSGGMFIRTREPKPLGARLQFRVELADGARVLRGTATVAWIRGPNDPKGPAGMGVRFEELDAASRSLVDRIAKGKELRSAEAPATPPEAPAPGAPSPAPKLPAEEPAKATPPPVAEAPVGEGEEEEGLDLNRLIADTLADMPEPPPTGPISLAGPEVKPGTASPEAQPVRLEAETPLEEAARAAAPARAVAVTPTKLAAPVAPVEGDGGIELELEPSRAAEQPPQASREVELEIELERPGGDEQPGGGLDLDGVDLDQALVIPTVPAPVSAPRAGPPAAPSQAPAAPTAPPASPTAVLTPSTAPAARPAPAPVATPATTPRASLTAPASPPSPPAQPAAPGAPAQGAQALPSIRRAPSVVQAAAERPVILQASSAVAKAAEALALASVKRPVFLAPPATIEGKGPIIGIDLGTTNSCVAVFSKGKPTVLRSKEGYWTIPSVLSVTQQGKVLVGHRAKQQLILNPGRTIYGAKRLVGRDFQSATVQQVRSRSHYEIIPDDAGRAAVRLGNSAITLEEAQGLVLRECREMAEQELGTKVERAVVTCPAYYSEPQREAVRRAGALAGLKVERILNEPTAAALAFGVNKELSKKILVYDLGGGTFDATVLRIDSNVFEVLATGGDIFLGGTDFDNQIVDFLLESLKDQPGFDLKADAVLLSRVTEAAEHAKVVLSERTSHEVHVPMLMMSKDGKPVDLRRTITRADLQRLVGDLVDKTIEVVHDVLLDAKLSAKDIDEVILVGGQSRMPLVREKLAGVFKKPAHASVNADEAVALGAAICASTIDKVCSVVLIDVVPMTIGLGLTGGGFRRVIERNTPLPAQRSFNAPTVEDNQTVMELSLFQGEDTSVAGNEYLGTVRIEGIPPAPKGAAKVAVTVKLDSECVLHVEALELATRKRIQTTLATRYSPEELQRQLAISKEKVAEVEARRGKDLEKRAGRFWGFLKKMVGKT